MKNTFAYDLRGEIITSPHRSPISTWESGALLSNTFSRAPVVITLFKLRLIKPLQAFEQAERILPFHAPKVLR